MVVVVDGYSLARFITQYEEIVLVAAAFVPIRKTLICNDKKMRRNAVINVSFYKV